MAPESDNRVKKGKIKSLLEMVWRRGIAKHLLKGRSQEPARKSGFLPRLKRHGPNKAYVLKGYTTRERVAEKRKRERRIQRNINIGIFIIFAVLVIILFYWLDPVGRFAEMARMLGL